VLEIEELQRRGEEERHQNVGVAEALERMDRELRKCRKDLDAAAMRARKVHHCICFYLLSCGFRDKTVLLRVESTLTLTHI
jgi:hypothetical protein